MSGHEFDRQQPADAEKLDASADPSATPPDDASLLGRVLEETLVMSSRPEAIFSPEFSPLLEVAHRHRGQALSLQGVTEELVLALLLQRFAAAGKPDSLWRTMAHDIAGALWDDPHMRARLEAFWRRLVDAVQ